MLFSPLTNDQQQSSSRCYTTVVVATHIANGQPMAPPSLPLRSVTGVRCAAPATAQHRNPEEIRNTPDNRQAANTGEEKHPSVVTAADDSSIRLYRRRHG